VIWIELTSPWEENLTKKHFEKMDKYNKLAIDLQEGKHHGVKWTVVPLCVEVGVAGRVRVDHTAIARVRADQDWGLHWSP